MVRIRKLTKKHYEIVFATFSRIRSPLGVNPYPLPLFRASLPMGIRGTVIHIAGKKSIVISRRLKSWISIAETVKHEMIHVALGTNNHGKDFRRACVIMGLNPKNHV